MTSLDGPVLTSLQNPHVKYARSLHQRKTRYRERAFLVEGVRLFLDALDAGAVPSRVFVDESLSDDRLAASLDELAARKIPVHLASTAVINAVADTQTPQGIVAIFDFPDFAIDTADETPLFVVADGIKDPGNLGTLLRAALGAGVHALYISSRTVDPYSPKVVRSAMGAHFRLPLRELDWDSPPEPVINCAQRIIAEAGGSRLYDQIDWTMGAVLIVGSEATGVSEEARRYATESVSIPLQGGLESLNAAVAGAVILFEAARQRRRQ